MAEKVIIDLEAKTGKAEANIQDVVDSINDLNKSFVEANENTAKSLKEVEKSSSNSAKGIKRIGKAIKVAGIGLLISGLTMLKEVFMQNQKVADFFNTSFEAISIAFNDFVGFIDENLGTITGFFKDIFENPREKLVELGSAIKQGLIDRFNQLLEVFGLVGKSLGQLIKGEFSAAFDTIKEAGKQTVDVVTGVDDSFEAVSETITEYTKKTIKAAKSNVELAKSAEIAAVLNQGLVEKYDRQAEQLRQIRDDESKSIEDRIKANEELALVLDEQEKAMKENAAIAVASAKAELDKNKENIQLQKAYQEALNEQAGIEAQITGFRSEQQTNTNSLLKEQKEIMNEIALFDKSERDKERLELKQQYEANKLLIEKEITDDAEKKERLLALQTDFNTRLKELNDGFYQEDEDAKQKNTDESNRIAKQQKDYKEQQYQSTYANLQTILSVGGKKLEKIGKALAIADVIRSSVKSVSETVSATGVANAKAVAASPLTGGMPFVAINTIKSALSVGATIAGAAKSIQSIKGNSKNVSNPPPLPNPGGGGGGGSASIPPAFNVVGASGTNQLASAIGGQTQKPIQAFVVSNDVSTAQEMDRNIIEGASIG